jgi:subtilisin family serine protease
MLVAGSLGLLAVIGCVDPPGDGFVALTVRADNVGATDVAELEIRASRLEVLISNTPDGEVRRHEVASAAGARVLLQFGSENLSFATVAFAAPKGFLHQIRIITDGVVVRGPATSSGSALAKLPSGAQTGLKVVPDDGTPFEIREGLTTSIGTSFAVASQLRRPPGQGLLFQPTLKAVLMAGPNVLPFVPGQVVVRFKDNVSSTDRDREIARFDSRSTVLVVLEPGFNMVAVSVPEDRNLLDALTFFGGSDKVEWTLPRILLYPRQNNPRPPGSPNDPNFTDGSQNYLNAAAVPTAWNRQVGRMNVIVAVLDTGIDVDHPDLIDNLFLNVGEIPPAITVVDADGDGVVTLRDLAAPANRNIAVFDANNDGRIDGNEVRAPINIDPVTGRNRGGLADGIDNDAVPGEVTNVVDDLIGARIGTFPAGSTTVVRDNRVDDDQAPTPQFNINGHGTAVSGLIGARGHNGTAIAGVAWNVRILPVKICDSQPACDFVMSLTNGMRYARRMGALVSNMSLGAPVQIAPKATDADVNQTILTPANDAYNTGLGGAVETMIHSIAAGNGRDTDGDGVPEGQNCSLTTVVCLPNEMTITNRIVVGATLADGSDRAGFSEFGTTTPAVGAGVDIGAPGVGNFSLNRVGGTQGGASVTGTSFAAPLVSGTAALIDAQNPSLTPAQVVTLILNNADSVPALADDFIGSRRLNAGAAVNAVP